MQPSLADLKTIALNPGDEPIPGFRLVRRRGRGGFGEVWEAEASGGFLVALKFVRLSSRARAAELRALEFVRGIHHPNLLANFGSWQVDDTLIIGMELADRSLWERYIEAADEGLSGIPRAELLGYLAEVAAGIGHLNEYRHSFDGRTRIGVQHRDIKPSNILLFGGGAKVADLGMARAMEGEVSGHTGIWTFSYAAPEFFRGETTRQSDQYGLAATYCQLRCGRLPFEGTAASVTAGHLFGKPDLDALPEPERPIVERALAKVPGDRWPDCRAFVNALRAIPSGEVPDSLIEPDSPVDIPREQRSSTGAISALPTGFDPLFGPQTGTGWRDFDSTDDRDDGLASPTGFPEHPAAPASADQVVTRILPASEPELPAIGPKKALAIEPELPAIEPKKALAIEPELPAIEPKALAIEPELPAVEPEPPVIKAEAEAPPAPSRRSARIRQWAAAAATVIALAAVGLQAPIHLQHGPDAPGAGLPEPALVDAGPRPPEPGLVVAGGIGSAAGLGESDSTSPEESPPPTPLPPAPIVSQASLKPVEPELAPPPASPPFAPIVSQASLKPVEPEPVPPPAIPPAIPIVSRASLKPVEPEPAPAPAAEEIRPAPIPSPEADLTPAAATIRPAPAPVTAHSPAPAVRPDLALEGPIELEVAGLGALSPLPPRIRELPPIPPRSGHQEPTAPRDPAGRSTPDQAGPQVNPGPIGGDRGKEARGRNPAAPVVRSASGPEGPAAHPPDPTPRTVAFNEPPTTSSPFRNIGPSPAEAAFARGRDLMIRESFARAVAEFDESIRLDPSHAASYLPRAVARHRSGHPDGALADYDEAIRRRSGDSLAYIARGQAHHDLGLFAKAIVDFDRAIQLNPKDADARLRRGLARYRSGDYAGSIADFDETLRLDPKNARATGFLADARARIEFRTDRATALQAIPGRLPASTPAPNRPPATASQPAAAPPARNNPAPANAPRQKPAQPQQQQPRPMQRMFNKIIPRPFQRTR